MEKNPDGHNTHSSFASTRFPAAHDVHEVLPVVDVRPCGHASQGVVLVLLSENAFARQSVQRVDPVASEYEP